MQTKKTDNANLAAKLSLRKYFLDTYPPSSVLDCCQGSKKIWNELLPIYHPRYFGVDLKPKKGRLKIDSIKILGQPGWDFDVVDIDTYGSPWRHWKNLLAYSDHDLTVFMTIGLVRIMGGKVATELYELLGFSQFDPKIPSSLASQCNVLAIPYCINRAERHDFEIVEALEAEPSQNARYIGIRIKKIA